MRVLVLHNPTAGDGRPSREDLMTLVEKAGFEAVYVSTKEDDYAAALHEPVELIIVAGGDGTVQKAAAALAGDPPPLAILPLGSANNVAHSLGISGRVGPLIQALRGAPVRRLARGTASGPWGRRVFVEGVGVGALARATAGGPDGLTDDDKQRAGRDALRRVLEEHPPLPLRLALDDTVVEGDFLMVEAMNIPTSGPRLPLAPGADPGDGLLDVVLVDGDRRAAMLAWLDDPSSAPPPAETRRCRRLSFTWSDAPLRVDDDLPDPPPHPRPVTVELAAEPLRVLVPGSTTNEGSER